MALKQAGTLLRAFDPLPLSATAFTSISMTAGTDKVAYVFRAPKAGTLKLVGFRTGTVTTWQDLKVSFQDVSAADGNPDGSADQYRVVTGADSDDNVWKTTGIMSSDGTDNGTKRTVTLDETVAVMIEWSGSTGSLNIASPTASTGQGTCYCTRNNGGLWAKQNVTPALAVQYDDGTWAVIEGALPMLTFNSVTFNSGSTPDEYALKFRLTFPALLAGVTLRVDRDGDYEMLLYDAGTVIATLDKDIRGAATEQWDTLHLGTAVELKADTDYRLAVRPSSGTSLILRSFTFNSANEAATVMGGASWLQSTRTDAGAWTDDATTKPLIVPLLGGFAPSGARLVNGGLAA